MQNLDISIWKNKDAKKKYPCTFIHSKILDHSRQKTNSFFPLKNDPFFFQSDFQTLYFSGFSLFYKNVPFPHRNTNFTMESFFQVVLWFSRGLSGT